MSLALVCFNRFFFGCCLQLFAIAMSLFRNRPDSSANDKCNREKIVVMIHSCVLDLACSSSSLRANEFSLISMQNKQNMMKRIRFKGLCGFSGFFDDRMDSLFECLQKILYLVDSPLLPNQLRLLPTCMTYHKTLGRRIDIVINDTNDSDN